MTPREPIWPRPPFIQPRSGLNITPAPGLNINPETSTANINPVSGDAGTRPGVEKGVGADFVGGREGGGPDTPSNNAVISPPKTPYGSFRSANIQPPSPGDNKSIPKGSHPSTPPVVIDVDIDCPVTSPLNGNGPKGWPAVSAKRKRERIATAEALEGLDPPSWPLFYVTLERIAAGLMDNDNLAAGFKAFRDEIATFLQLDDADPRIVWTYRQRQQRVRDPAVTTKTAWKSFARAVIAPTPETAKKESPDFEPRKISTASKSSRAVVPEPRGGNTLETVELPIRWRTSRLGAALRVNPRDSAGLKAGERYIRLATYWEGRWDAPYRTQGVVILPQEIDALCAVLQALKNKT